MRLSPDAIKALAPEYVLGTLRGGARRRLEAMLRDNRALAAEVRLWEDALTPIAEGVAPLDPPKRVWSNIESRVASARAAPPASGFWRAFGLVAGGVASVLFAFFAWISVAPRAEPLFVAVLADTAPRMVVSMHQPDLLRVTVMKPWGGMENRSLELWVLPKQGAPRSLGLVSNVPGDTTLRISPSDPRVQGANALAVSMEPAGGSPTGLPTGAVVCSGMIATVKPRRV
ncbi:MAG TPA: anti-sigma factor [Usitatibacter sp.]